jgi:hypothetical protein
MTMGLCLAISSADARPRPTDNTTDNIKMELEHSALLYFIENANPHTGLVRDKAESFGPTPASNNVASLGATGFALTVIANASQRAEQRTLLDRKQAEHYFNKVMRFCRDSVPREHGWFLHWVNWQTGQSVWDDANDYSSIDSAFLIAGALYAARIFPHSAGAKIARQLYREMDFPWLMTDGGRYPQRRTLSIGYHAGQGFLPYQWSIYAEQMILVVLGLGSPTYPLPPEVWNQWERRKYSSAGFDFVAMDMPLFVHQYSQLFLDFRNFDDGYPNYFTTGVEATRFNRFVGNQALGNGFWGFSAGQAPGTGDETYGIFTPLKHTTTVCIGCAMGSAMFEPSIVLEDARRWRASELGDQIWGRYGFTDSVDVEKNWHSDKTLGITVGAAYLSLANMHSDTSIWAKFSEIPEINAGLRKIQR